MTASFTATITTADYFSREQRTFSYTGSQEQAQTWLTSMYLAAADDVLSAGLVETPEVHVETRQERVARVLHEIQVAEDAAELDKLRREGRSYRKTWHGGPVPTA